MNGGVVGFGEALLVFLKKGALIILPIEEVIHLKRSKIIIISIHGNIIILGPAETIFGGGFRWRDVRMQ
jgi:hypothetical protein